jgi:hypothetical protein
MNTSELQAYFDSTSENYTGDPYGVTTCYVLGKALASDDPEVREIAENFVKKCGELCSTGEFYQAYIRNGGNDDEALSNLTFLNKEVQTA